MEPKRFSDEDLTRAKKVNLQRYFGAKEKNGWSFYESKKNPGHWLAYSKTEKKTYNAIDAIMNIEKKSFVDAIKSLLSFADSIAKESKNDTSIASLTGITDAQKQEYERLMKLPRKEWEAEMIKRFKARQKPEEPYFIPFPPLTEEQKKKLEEEERNREPWQVKEERIKKEIEERKRQEKEQELKDILNPPKPKKYEYIDKNHDVDYPVSSTFSPVRY